MEAVNTQIVKISAAEAKAQGLPAVEITLDVGETGMSGLKFPAKGEYLKLSGPPGGRLGIRFIHIPKPPTNKAEWKNLIEQRLEEESPELGSLGQIELAGGKHPAFTCTAGEGPSRAHHLLVLIAVPKSEESLLVDFYRSGRPTPTPSPDDLKSDGKFADISRSLSIKFE